MKRNHMKKRSVLIGLSALMSFTMLAQDLWAASPSVVKLNFSDSKHTNMQIREIIKIKGSHSVYISPDVDTTSNGLIRVLVTLRSEPLAVQMHTAKSSITSSKAQSARLAIDNEQEAFLKTTKEKNISVTVNYSYNTVMNGMEITVPASQITKLARIPQVKSIHDNIAYYPLPAQSYLSYSSNIAYDLPPLQAINVSEAWSKSTGKGLKVGVIDTGVDYLHPDLEPAYKGGYDSYSNDTDPYEELPIAKSDAPDGADTAGTSHGTHVAGQIVGRASNIGSDIVKRGIAYEADFYAYKIYGRDTQTGKITSTSAQVIDAIERAVKDGVHVISLSLGSDEVRDRETPEAIAINNSTLSGVTTVVARSSQTQKGEYYDVMDSTITAPFGIAVNPTSVAQPKFTATVTESVYNTSHRLQVIGWSGEPTTLSKQLGSMAHDAVYVGTGRASEYANKNAKDKVVFASRGTITYENKVKIASQNGAKAIIIFNGNSSDNEADLSPSVSGFDGYANVLIGSSYDWIPAFDMQGHAGATIAKQFIANSAISFKFSDYEFDQQDREQIISRNWNNTSKNDQLRIKPDFSAPGESIMSTTPLYGKYDDKVSYKQAYGHKSGAGMAVATVAGAALLLKQSNPEWTPLDIRAALANTADLITNHENQQYNVFTQGTGRINIAQAQKTPVVVQTIESLDASEATTANGTEIINYGTSINFGMFSNTSSSQTVPLLLKNTSTSAIEYSATIVMDPSVIANSNSQLSKDQLSRLDVKLEGLTNDRNIFLKGQSTTSLNFTMKPDKQLANGFYQGHIQLEAPFEPTLHVPFVVQINNSSSPPSGRPVLTLSKPELRLNKDSEASTINIEFTMKKPAAWVQLDILDDKDEYVGTIASWNRETNTTIDYNQFELSQYDGTYYSGNRVFTNGKYVPQRLKEGNYTLRAFAQSASDSNHYLESYRSFTVTSIPYEVEQAAQRYSSESKAVIPSGTTINSAVLSFPVTPNISYKVTNSSNTKYISHKGTLQALPKGKPVSVEVTVTVTSLISTKVSKQIIVKVTLSP